MNNIQIKQRRYILHLLSAATFIIFFQLYMIAPLIPTFAVFFKVPEQTAGLIVPAYLLPYGISTLFYGLLSDRVGPKKIILISLFMFSILTAFTALSQSVNQLIAWRFITGIGASGIVPIALAWIGQTYAFEERGRALGWLFGAMAGGGAVGSSVGVILEPFIGWRMLFFTVAITGAIIWLILYKAYKKITVLKVAQQVLTINKVLDGYKQLLLNRRGIISYGFVLLNAIFHAGVFTWLGLYFKSRYDLNGVEIGLAILGYGVPGFLLGPYIGKLADSFGRRKLLPFGLALSALSSLIIVFNIPLGLATIAVTFLSMGYDFTQPLLAGIITQIGKERSGQAMSLNVCMLFIGFGTGSYLFGLALKQSLTQALIIFSIFQFILSLIALPLFKNEQKNNQVNIKKVSYGAS